MFKTLFKYAAAVTAAKGDAQDKAAMAAAGMATLTDPEKAMMEYGSMPGWKSKIDDAAWAGKTFTEQWPDVALSPEVAAKLNEALTPQVP